MRSILLSYGLLLSMTLFGQSGIPESLLEVKSRMDAVETAKGTVTLNLDIDFINMPEKKASISYVKGEPLDYESDNFIFIPKKGLDFSWNNLFDYQFIAVDRGIKEVSNEQVQTYSIIPDDKRADFSIMTLEVNLTNYQIVSAEISTKKEGTYQLKLDYDGSSPLPSNVEASFELEKVRIPINFMGSDTDIDRKSMRSDGTKTGKVYLTLDWSEIKP